MARTHLLKWLLRLSGAIQIGYWSLSHLFFPTWYLRSVGMTELARNPGGSLVFIHEIGVLTLGTGVATWMAASKPVERFPIIVMLYVVGLGSIATSLFHILSRAIPPGEWITIAIISVQMLLVTILFPWSRLCRDRTP